MTDELRAKNAAMVEANRAAAAKPTRTLRQKLAALLGRQPKAVTVTPKRISGPRLVPDNWHEAGPNAALAGQRCLNQACREVMLPGSDPLHTLAGLCGKCFQHAQGNPAPPLHSEPDGPPMEAA